MNGVGDEPGGVQGGGDRGGQGDEGATTSVAEGEDDDYAKGMMYNVYITSLLYNVRRHC